MDVGVSENNCSSYSADFFQKKFQRNLFEKLE
jgi:hypothetical protein